MNAVFLITFLLFVILFCVLPSLKSGAWRLQSVLKNKQVLISSVAFVLFATLVYGKVGDYSNVSLWQANKVVTAYYEQLLEQAEDQDTAKAVIATIKQRLQDNPDEVQGWLTMARLELELNDLPAAVKDYEQALSFYPDDIGIRSEYAHAQFRLEKGHISPALLSQLEQIIEDDPNNQQVMHLLAAYYFQEKNYRRAIWYWQALLSNTETASDQALLNKMISVARAKQAETNPYQLTVKLTASGQTKYQFSGQETVFVIVKRPEQRQPLWVKKVPISALPMEVVLDANDAMLDSDAIVEDEPLQVKVRISQTKTVTGAEQAFEMGRILRFSDNNKSPRVTINLG